MFNYHLVWCRVVEDLIDSPHLSQDCTKGQQVTQRIYPGVQLFMYAKFHSLLILTVLLTHCNMLLMVQTSYNCNWSIVFGATLSLLLLPRCCSHHSKCAKSVNPNPYMYWVLRMLHNILGTFINMVITLK